MVQLQNILLMASPEGEGGALSSLLPLLLVVVVFYFFMIRPQMKKSKDQKKFREAIKKGDKVITIGGIHGKIVEVQDTTFTIEVENGVKMRIEKNAISMDAGSMLTQQQK